MTATTAEFYQIKAELQQLTPEDFKVEFCYTWDAENKVILEDDQHIQSVSVGKIRPGASTLWLIHIDTVEELEAFKEWKSFEPTPAALAADEYWNALDKDKVKGDLGLPLEESGATGPLSYFVQPDGSVLVSHPIPHEGQDWLDLKVGGFQE